MVRKVHPFSYAHEHDTEVQFLFAVSRLVVLMEFWSEVQSIRIGEESGRLVDVCQQLADHHADRIALRRSVRQAFIYPLFILVVTAAVVLFMMNVVVPMFAQVFERTGSELPALTRWVLDVSDLMRRYWPIGLMAMGLVGAGWMAVRKQPLWRSRAEVVVLRTPVLGGLQRKAMMARFCRAMAFLLSSGSPLDRALQLSERLCDSPHLERALERVRHTVVRGRSLREAMAHHSIFDEQLVAMIGVAEEVKQLDAMFRRLGERYMADVQHRTALLGSILEPLTILLIAIVVGVVLVAMYLPMFKLSTAF